MHYDTCTNPVITPPSYSDTFPEVQEYDLSFGDGTDFSAYNFWIDDDSCPFNCETSVEPSYPEWMTFYTNHVHFSQLDLSKLGEYVVTVRCESFDSEASVDFTVAIVDECSYVSIDLSNVVT